MNQIFRYIYIILFLLPAVILLQGCSDKRPVYLRIIASTDVHGNIFSEDLVNGKISGSSMSKASSFIKSGWVGEKLVFDNGDNLQGSPSVYYYNFEDTLSPHLWAEVLNWIGYNAVTVGNHDIEAGHSVYDRVRKQYGFPLLAANAVSTETGEPYFEPYAIFDRGGIKVAVLGLVTPGIPGWLPEVLYNGIRFEDMTESAVKWMPEILKQKPDIIIGLFHSGWDENYGTGTTGSFMNENASMEVARKVPGFDIVFIGHDHDILKESVVNINGDSVIILDGGSHARYLSVADVTITASGRKGKKKIDGYFVSTDTLLPDKDFDQYFNSNYRSVHNYVNREIGRLSQGITTRDSYFGDSPFIDLIHNVQLSTSGADISFAAPLSFDVTIPAGKVLVSDMFDLYRYENMLYTIELTGKEIDSYLEYSYGLWTGMMRGPGDYLLKYEAAGDKGRLANRYYNFDSAEGIIYTVDVSKPEGDRVTITELIDGRSFDAGAKYKVALNSYRGSGGGGHLKIGCGLNDSEINDRLLHSTEKDLRYYMIKWFENNGTIEASCNNNWRFIPSGLTEGAVKREQHYLFNK